MWLCAVLLGLATTWRAMPGPASVSLIELKPLIWSRVCLRANVGAPCDAALVSKAEACRGGAGCALGMLRHAGSAMLQMEGLCVPVPYQHGWHAVTAQLI